MSTNQLPQLDQFSTQEIEKFVKQGQMILNTRRTKPLRNLPPMIGESLLKRMRELQTLTNQSLKLDYVDIMVRTIIYSGGKFDTVFDIQDSTFDKIEKHLEEHKKSQALICKELIQDIIKTAKEHDMGVNALIDELVMEA